MNVDKPRTPAVVHARAGRALRALLLVYKSIVRRHLRLSFSGMHGRARVVENFAVTSFERPPAQLCSIAREPNENDFGREPLR